MSCQWNALNVNVIKTRKIECGKLNLPAALAKSPSKKSTASPKLASTDTENLNSYSAECKEPLSKNHSSVDGLISLLSTEDSLNSSVCTEDEVFQESFETPPEKDSTFSKSSTKRCLSLPTYLTSEEGFGNSIESDVCFRPRRLFEEALNLESYSGSTRSSRVDSRAFNQGLGGHIFPRVQENIHKGKASRTTHAERMKRTKSSSVITCDNNNNVVSDQNNLESTKSSFKTQSKDRFDVRDWEQKVLVLTADYEFGTESSKKRRDESDTRSRSVALTENISTVANDKIAKDQNIQRQVKSETQSDMPKLQSVVWDYIKRKSTKRKRKIETARLEQDENLKEGNLKAANQESSSENVENSDIRKCKDELPTDVKSSKTDSAVRLGRINTGITADISRESRPIKLWKSTPNLNSNCDSKMSQNIPLRRYNSHNILSPSHKSPPKLPAKELKLNSETLTFLLTTATQEKPIHERMMTLKLSREWLLKELKSMREQDRKLARQFIHLRSAIVEMREYCEREDSECDSECEGTQKAIDAETSHKNNKITDISKERKIQIHNTPTINILSYC